MCAGSLRTEVCGPGVGPCWPLKPRLLSGSFSEVREYVRPTSATRQGCPGHGRCFVKSLHCGAARAPQQSLALNSRAQINDHYLQPAIRIRTAQSLTPSPYHVHPTLYLAGTFTRLKCRSLGPPSPPKIAFAWKSSQNWPDQTATAGLLLPDGRRENSCSRVPPWATRSAFGSKFRDARFSAELEPTNSF